MQVAIKFVNFPRVGSSGKYGSIVGQDGTKIMVPVDMLPMFRQGTVVDIATKEQIWGDPNNPVIVATSGPGGGGPTGAVQGRGNLSGYQGATQQSGYQRASTGGQQGFQPRVVQGGSGGPVGMPAGPDQSRQIFITGVVGRAMGSGKFSASEVLVLTEAAAEAYDRLTNPKKEPPRGNYLQAADTAWANQPPEPEPGDPGPDPA